MIESLEELSREINHKGGKLYTFYGENNYIVKQCIKEFDIEVVSFNYDVTPYAINRDNEIINICNTLNINFIVDNDYFLYEPRSILNGSGNVYQKFTPYYLQTLHEKSKINEPTNLNSSVSQHFVKKDLHLNHQISLKTSMDKFVSKINTNILVNGGRKNAIKILHTAVKNLNTSYSHTKDFFGKDTSHLSAYLKFGCVSVREVYDKMINKDFRRQLIWREFYANLMFEYPDLLYESKHFYLKPKYNKIKWLNNKSWLKKWCDAETGFPLIDAGMRELNQTGYMHNKLRLITCCFLIKTLLINWRYGEKYFANKLTDYDPIQNNLNFQWILGSTFSAQEYYRFFNPFSQSEKYDPNCEYIKKWIHELKDVPAKDINKWNEKWMDYLNHNTKNNGNINYPKPICDFSEQREKCLKLYKEALH